MPAGCSIFATCLYPPTGKNTALKTGRKKVDQELKGASFEETLQSDLYGIRLAPLYTDRPAETSNEEEDILGEHEQSGMQWQATVHSGTWKDLLHPSCRKLYRTDLLDAHQRAGISFLDQLAKEVPLPVTLCLEAESVPASEDEVLEWRDKLRKAKATTLSLVTGV